MSAETVIAISLFLMMLTHVVGLLFVLYTLYQLRYSAEAVEVLAHRTREQIEAIGETTRSVRDVAGAVNSPWVRSLAGGLTALAFLWARKPNSSK